MKRPAIPLIVLSACVLISLGGALFNGFAWDDRPLIVENRLVKDPGSLGTLLTTGFWEAGDRHDRFRSFFRPLVSLSYAIDYALWGLRPAGFHLTNLLLHLLCCLCVHALARRFLEPLPALFGAALFAVHPVHVESAAWISGRTDLLCALFLLLAFLAHLDAASRGKGRRLPILPMFYFALALLSKEMAATFPILVCADRLLRPAEPRRRAWRAALAAFPYLCVLIIYIGVRRLVLGGGAPPLYHLGPEAFAGTALFVLARYVTLLILPLGYDPHYPYAPRAGLIDPVVVLSVAVLAVTVGAVAWIARRDRQSRFPLAWIPITLLPVFGFGTFGDVLLADRFLYIPSVGFALLAGLAAARLESEWRSRTDSPGVRGLRRSCLAGALAMLALLSLQSQRLTRVWKDDDTLFSRLALTSQDSAMVRCNLGLALYDRGEFDAAKDEFRTAIALVPGYALAHNNLAAALEREGRFEEALLQYRQALQIAPQQIETEVNVGSLLVRLGRPAQGMSRLRAVLQKAPRYPQALYAFADAAAQAGENALAEQHLAQAIAIDPFYANPYYLRGKIQLEEGHPDEAAQSMRRFCDLWPHDDEHRRAAEAVIARAAAAPPPDRGPREPGPAETAPRAPAKQAPPALAGPIPPPAR